MKQIQKMLFRVFIERALGYFVSNSTQIITDLQTAASATLLATQLARANVAAGPITDLPGSLDLLVKKAKEMVQLMSYILEGSQIQTSLTAPAGGLVQTGDSNAATTWNVLTGVYQILK